MTLLAENLFRHRQHRLGRLAVGVVTHSAFLKLMYWVLVRRGESRFLMARETAAFEAKAPPAADAVALRAGNLCDGRVLKVRLELGGGSFSDKEVHFFASAFPS